MASVNASIKKINSMIDADKKLSEDDINAILDDPELAAAAEMAIDKIINGGGITSGGPAEDMAFAGNALVQHADPEGNLIGYAEGSSHSISSGQYSYAQHIGSDEPKEFLSALHSAVDPDGMIQKYSSAPPDVSKQIEVVFSDPDGLRNAPGMGGYGHLVDKIKNAALADPERYDMVPAEYPQFLLAESTVNDIMDKVEAREDLTVEEANILKYANDKIADSPERYSGELASNLSDAVEKIAGNPQVFALEVGENGDFTEPTQTTQLAMDTTAPSVAGPGLGGD